MEAAISVFKTTGKKRIFFEAYNAIMKSWSIPYENKWIETSFGKTHVVVSGPQDGEQLVLLPGAQATSAMWAPMITVLTQKRRVFCIDLIDQVGLSEPQKVLKNTQDSNKWLEETLNGLQIDKVSICGNSLGSFITSMFAINHPERVNKVILTAPAATVTSVRLSYIYKVLYSTMTSKIEIKKSFLRYTAAGLIDENNKLFQLLLKAMTCSKIISKIQPRKLTTKELSNLKSPALVILGAKDVTSNKSVENIVNELVKSDLMIETEIIKEAGHIWTEQQYIYAAKKIEIFLNKK